MKLIAENSAVFKNSIDASFGPESSIVCRYRNALQLTDDAETDLAIKNFLLASSIREGARIIRLLNYKGVNIDILDETSLMATGSLKSIDGCLTTAFCRMEGAKRVAFESGGNSGSALTQYGRKAGLETFFFCPVENLDLLDSRLFDKTDSHLIGVRDRGQVKALTGLFARTTGIRHIPDKSWRYAAAMFRGLFILEQMLATTRYGCISQTISAGFGPIGIYNVLKTFQSELRGLPRFLGIQQETNSPMFAAWKPGVNGLPGNDDHKTDRLLTRVMYDNSPQTYQTFSDLQKLLLLSQGDLLTVNKDEFDTYQTAEYGQLLDLLLSRDISISLRSGQVVEKTGMIALAGTFKAIDNGVIKAGSKVLCCLTSGVTQADGRAQPELTVGSAQDVLEYVETVQGGE